MNATYAPEPAEAQSIKSLLHVVRILAVIFGVLLFLAGLAYAVGVLYFLSFCSGMMGTNGYCGAPVVGSLTGPILLVIFGIVDVVIYLKMKEIEGQVNAGHYQAAKDATFLWMILGFILGGIIVGVLLLIAYIKFGPLINASRQAAMGGTPPVNPYPVPTPGGVPTPLTSPSAGAPPPPPPDPAAAPPVAPFCTKCGRPTTYIPQYGRYYCYTDQLYV